MALGSIAVMKNLDPQGRVIWITGLSGAGKTTVAQAAARCLRLKGMQPVVLDGDEVRDAVRDPHTGHDRVSRIANAYRICRLAKLLAEQGHLVLVATMSLFSEIHRWNREQLPNYLEVYLKVDWESLVARDARGLYSRLDHGNAHNIAGLDLDFDEPVEPDLVLENQEPFIKPEKLAEKILDHFQVIRN